MRSRAGVRRRRHNSPALMNISQDAYKIAVMLSEKELTRGRPSEECTDKAAELNAHDEFFSLLRTRRTTGTWPKNDKMADQLPQEYDPMRLVVAAKSTLSSETAARDPSSNSAAKKARVDLKANSSLLLGPNAPKAAKRVRPPKKNLRRKYAAFGSSVGCDSAVCDGCMSISAIRTSPVSLVLAYSRSAVPSALRIEVSPHIDLGTTVRA
ncbi:hypothetical protein BD413DRAFT_312797 [Trametes elegans]|nr:hypothetical protein BD413DRAFT_312797 [Trametes elegans]